MERKETRLAGEGGGTFSKEGTYGDEGRAGRSRDCRRLAWEN